MAILSLASARPAGWPARVELAALPTPLLTAPRLAALLGLGLLHVKRDDLTGFALGGNKVRSLEFLIADAGQQGADTLVTGGGSAGRPVLPSGHRRRTCRARARPRSRPLLGSVRHLDGRSETRQRRRRAAGRGG